MCKLLRTSKLLKTCKAELHETFAAGTYHVACQQSNACSQRFAVAARLLVFSALQYGSGLLLHYLY
jgi:hypothetical protein